MALLREMIATQAQPGRVVWIGLRPARRAPMRAVDAAMITDAGLDGDRSRGGKRAVTLVQHEHLPVIGSFLGRGPLAVADLRRNLCIAGINLGALKGRRVRVGAAVLEWTVICAPCSRMEETFGRGGYSAVRGHGGWCAKVITPGPVRLGDAVYAEPDAGLDIDTG
ncbi:MAG: MOSC domain-containing protein [Marinibacterium sp.]|nr:MOSC domain-containing protein [Marinibacterium sp.]